MKGIIVVDMPETCRHIRGENEKGCLFGGMVCQLVQKDVMRYTVNGAKPSWCPIRPIPERKKAPSTGYMIEEMFGREIGWNACIDSIEGRKECDV